MPLPDQAFFPHPEFRLGGLPPHDLLKRGVKTNRPGALRAPPLPARSFDDSPLYPPGNGLHLGGADAFQDLVRDRGACGGRAGRARHDPEGSGEDDLGQGEECHLRRRPDRRDRARDQARRHRLPDASGRNRRPRGALRAPGHDVVRRARHLPQCAAGPRRRPPDCRHRQGAGGAEDARLRAQDDADHRPLPRHPCRARHLRAEARLCLCGILARARAADRRAQGSRDLRHLGRGRHVRADRSARGRTCRESHGPRARAGIDPGDPARPACDVFCHARRDRRVGRAAGDRNPPSAAHRGAGGRGVLLGGPEGLLRHAAQAQPGAVGEPHRACRAWCAPM